MWKSVCSTSPSGPGSPRSRFPFFQFHLLPCKFQNSTFPYNWIKPIMTHFFHFVSWCLSRDVMIHISNLHNKRVGEPLPGCPLGTRTLATVEALPTPWRSVLPFPWQVCECLLPADVGHSIVWTWQVLYLRVTKYAWSQYHQLVLLVLIADLPLQISWWVYSFVRLKTMRAKK